MPLDRSPEAHPRMTCRYVPQGVNIYDWFPQETGRDWKLTPTLQGLGVDRERFMDSRGTLIELT